jgi:hypothetical protein
MPITLSGLCIYGVAITIYFLLFTFIEQGEGETRGKRKTPVVIRFLLLPTKATGELKKLSRYT